MLSIPKIIYLHGWCSGPESNKAQFFKKQVCLQGAEMLCPDLNQGDFFNLSLSRQIQQVRELIAGEPCILIGSSLGGLASLWIAEQEECVRGLILMAPAVNFYQNALRTIGEEVFQTWQEQGSYEFEHYAQGQELALSFRFMNDVRSYCDKHLQRRLPTLVLHGERDEVIAFNDCANFCEQRPWTEFVCLDDDHSLSATLPQIWQRSAEFLRTYQAF